MKHQCSSRRRKALRLKMATVFSEEIQMLSEELQEILLDDLITAFENRLNVLNRARLEMYVGILSILAHLGPLKLTRIKCKVNVNCSVLSEDLAFLMQKGLVEKRNAPKDGTVYAITQRGITVVQYFGELKQLLPITEDQKQLLPLF